MDDNDRLALPEGACWASCEIKGPIAPRYPHLMRKPWWRFYKRTTIYAGTTFTPVVYCDTEATADLVLAAHNKD